MNDVEEMDGAERDDLAARIRYKRDGTRGEEPFEPPLDCLRFGGIPELAQEAGNAAAIVCDRSSKSRSLDVRGSA